MTKGHMLGLEKITHWQNSVLFQLIIVIQRRGRERGEKEREREREGEGGKGGRER